MIALRNMAQASSFKKLLLCILLAMPLSALAEGDSPESSEPVMNVIEQNRYGEILVVPNVDWSQYSGVQIEVSSVEFRDRWKHERE